MADVQREYEIVVLGATGYTGKYTAEHITTSLPTDLKWAVAGRSEAKLKQVLSDLKSLNADRPEPGIEIATLQKDDIVRLAKKTKVLITTIGPYHKYGTVVFEACAETGTHYLDVTGEVPWVLQMVQKYHETAKRSGAIVSSSLRPSSMQLVIDDLLRCSVSLKTASSQRRRISCVGCSPRTSEAR